MKKPRYAWWIIGTEAVGILSGLLSRSGIERYTLTASKPPLSPPAVLFPVVWAVLYALMGVGAARFAAKQMERDRSRALNIYVIQLIVNFFWSLIFFNTQAFGFAFGWILLLWALIVLMILAFWRVDKLSALLQLPYLIWVSFAAYLNGGVWQLNR